MGSYGDTRHLDDALQQLTSIRLRRKKHAASKTFLLVKRRANTSLPILRCGTSTISAVFYPRLLLRCICSFHHCKCGMWIAFSVGEALWLHLLPAVQQNATPPAMLGAGHRHTVGRHKGNEICVGTQFEHR
jgi:hypothetical protein